MNVLIDKFPTKIEIDNTIHKINSDFRTCLQIIFAFEDIELTIQEKTEIMLELLYEEVPKNFEKAIEKAVLFLNCGEKNKNSENSGEINNRVYSFARDAKYIYSAIKQTHNIDLENIEYLHWWKFVFLFLDLNKESFFSKMIYLRTQKQKNALTKEEKELYFKLIDILEIETIINYTEEEQKLIEKFDNLLNGGKNE